ncbi:phosphate ABC transporter, permease protein PstA [Candidatus Peribacteria bacterium RIFCSPHIGHO2_02_FULL_49_16]|nr:MAG: phosphate ABC transporter, permease protein PstA [Candidatus Peribacteria bacterium RIFCSPHIGHO2_01_FULL_49_38]OGJ58700.1 MAG: phosphate ABC transporter, permease protein PstA [Candidatus Peribacteria bacterium RIFCSPHIGHO2_02_FULL_49_16]
MHKFADRMFITLSLAALMFTLLMLFALLVDVFVDGVTRLNGQFLTSFPSRKPEEAGILAALVGSVSLITLTAAIAVPLGVGSAVYLEQYAKRSRFNALMDINIGTLAGVPSIIYGLLGLALFVRVLALDRSLISGALTLSLLILPIIIIASREAIRVVPTSLQDGAFAIGATRSQVIRRIVFPLALPGILTGIILALSRAIGETAPLIAIGALTYIAFLPDSLSSPFTAMPIQIFNWVSRPQEAFHANAAAGIILLLAITLLFNAVAICTRNHFYKISAHCS